MRKVTVCLVVALAMIFGMVVVGQAATTADAKAMVEKAVAFWKANGKEKAVEEFNNPKGQFVKGDLYVFANELTGLLLANGGNPKLVGQNHLELKDPAGKYFNKECVELAKTKGSGWVDYVWVNPVSKKVQPKTVWIQKVEGTDVYIGSGIWK
jgi:cytochrome c